MGLIEKLADIKSPTSLSNRLRTRRFSMFERLVGKLPKPVRIIDLGGTAEFWKQRGCAERPDYQITTVNIDPSPSDYSNISSIYGDVRNLTQFEDNSFDVSFSNSVIEHLFEIRHQRAMAHEHMRLAKAWWLQTPNFWFPIEPHFHLPGWQWLPEGARIAIIRRVGVGHRGQCPDRVRAKQIVQEIRLLTRRELIEMFPNGSMWAERFAGLVKSWVCYGGFDGTRDEN